MSNRCSFDAGWTVELDQVELRSPVLIFTQGENWIQVRRAARGKVTGESRHGEEDRGTGEELHRIACAEQNRLAKLRVNRHQDAGQTKSEREPDAGPNHGHDH